MILGVQLQQFQVATDAFNLDLGESQISFYFLPRLATEGLVPGALLTVSDAALKVSNGRVVRIAHRAGFKTRGDLRVKRAIRPDRPLRACCLGDRTSSHCSRSNIPNEKSVVRGLSGCLSKIATHPIDPLPSVRLWESGRLTFRFSGGPRSGPSAATGCWTQAEAAKNLGVSQSRVSDLMRGKWDKFSLDMLVTLASRAGLNCKLKLAA